MTEKKELRQSTFVDEVALRAVVRLWMFTPCLRVQTIAGERQDLYLKLVAHAAQLSYDEARQRWLLHDDGIVEARRRVKRMIFNRLMRATASILQVHDHVVVVETPTVESGDGPQELANRAR